MSYAWLHAHVGHTRVIMRQRAWHALFSRQLQTRRVEIGMAKSPRDRHWFRTSRLMWLVLIVWAFLAFAVHLLVSPLNQLRFLGYPLGYYVAAQGSFGAFAMLVVWFSRRQDRIDREALQAEEQERPSS